MNWTIIFIWLITSMFAFGIGAAILETRDDVMSDDYVVLTWCALLWPFVLGVIIVLSPVWIPYIIVLKIRER